MTVGSRESLRATLALESLYVQYRLIDEGWYLTVSQDGGIGGRAERYDRMRILLHDGTWPEEPLEMKDRSELQLVCVEEGYRIMKF